MESVLQTKCLTYARKAGCLAFKMVAVSFIGFPDTLIIFPGGKIVFVELKTKTGKLRPGQKRRIAQLRRYNCNVFVIDNLEDFKALF